MKKEICQDCKFQVNKPSNCTTKEEYVPRKGKTCESFTRKKKKK